MSYLFRVATIGHLALGIAAGRVHARDRSDRIGHSLLFGLLAALPDADLLAVVVGHPYALPHRGPTHSLAFAAMVATLVAMAAPYRWVTGGSRLRTWTLAFLAVASHALVDPLIAGSGGTALLWPLSSWKFTWGHFQPIPEAFTGFAWPFFAPAQLAIEALLFSPFFLCLFPLRRRVTLPKGTPRPQRGRSTDGHPRRDPGAHARPRLRPPAGVVVRASRRG